MAAAPTKENQPVPAVIPAGRLAALVSSVPTARKVRKWT